MNTRNNKSLLPFVSRKEAKRRGLKRYFTGVPCKHGHCEQRVCDDRCTEWQAGMRPWSGCLCIGCLEKRIGRQLRPKDFSSHDDKVWADLPCTERLLNRRGFATVTVQTKNGPQEIVCDIEVAPRIAGSFMETDEAA